MEQRRRTYVYIHLQIITRPVTAWVDPRILVQRRRTFVYIHLPITTRPITAWVKPQIIEKRKNFCVYILADYHQANYGLVGAPKIGTEDNLLYDVVSKNRSILKLP